MPHILFCSLFQKITEWVKISQIHDSFECFKIATFFSPNISNIELIEKTDAKKLFIGTAPEIEKASATEKPTCDEMDYEIESKMKKIKNVDKGWSNFMKHT